ncbi:hypothetical protein Tco_0352761 [Tanacetum coccineum]
MAVTLSGPDTGTVPHLHLPLLDTAGANFPKKEQANKLTVKYRGVHKCKRETMAEPSNAAETQANTD